MPQTEMVRAIEKALPSVVSIRSLPERDTTDEYAVSEEISGEALEALGGSGFVVSRNGIIVTNKHVVANPNARYEAILQNGSRYAATVLTCDPVTDVAFLKIKTSRLAPLALGSAKDLKLGETVVAIGNALGQFANTVSAGIVSGLSRSLIAALDERGAVEELEGLIQTDAAINPGNSGGPLINLRGEAVGINIATVLGAQSLGFAIPIDIVKRDLKEIFRFGRIRRVYLGIRYIPVDETIAKEQNLASASGALVFSDTGLPAVAPNSPAHHAGIREHDLIVAANGERITREKSLTAILAQAHLDAPIRLTILRGRKKLSIRVMPTEWRLHEEGVPHVHAVPEGSSIYEERRE